MTCERSASNGTRCAEGGRCAFGRKPARSVFLLFVAYELLYRDAGTARTPDRAAEPSDADVAAR